MHTLESHLPYSAPLNLPSSFESLEEIDKLNTQADLHTGYLSVLINGLCVRPTVVAVWDLLVRCVLIKHTRAMP